MSKYLPDRLSSTVVWDRYAIYHRPIIPTRQYVSKTKSSGVVVARACVEGGLQYYFLPLGCWRCTGREGRASVLVRGGGREVRIGLIAHGSCPFLSELIISKSVIVTEHNAAQLSP